MEKLQIQVLDRSGHLTLEWNPEDEADVQRAREEVKRLADAGYSFFLTDREPADPVAAGRGRLLVKRVEDPVAELSKAGPEMSASGRRGRSPRGAVAVRPMAGG